MTVSLRNLLTQYRDAATTERDKGTYFEKLTVAFLKNDAVMKDQFEDAWLFADWANDLGLNAKDTGIDVVAKLRDSEQYCAVQCKFYAEGHIIQKSDIDSFFTASGKSHFARRIIIDTTNTKWSSNANEALQDQQVPCTRIELSKLAESNIDWQSFLGKNEITILPPKTIRPHQKEAIEAVREGLREADRGKLIMACGTGKTFTGLKIAEDLAGAGKNVLFLVPSLALMSQTIREWHNDTATPLRSFSVCSDIQVGKRRVSQDDVAEIEASDLEIQATTRPDILVYNAKQSNVDKMTVVFSTYQSIQTISQAQTNGLPEFDLIICDEAHRTTGATVGDDEDSNFVRIHDNNFIRAKKRVYMTATPRVFGENVKAKANEVAAVLYSMDDEELYGKTLFQRGFGWAVENGLLTDYKVLVLAVDEGMVSSGVQNRLADGTSELKLDDATKIIGCYKALAKIGLTNELLTDPHPMRRAIAFCKDIKTSKLVTKEFAQVVTEYLSSPEGIETMGEATPLVCEFEHVDGTYGAKERSQLLDWIKEETEQNCRILSNARCLSEGVDVPALDAILFMHPRKSQIDVVQSVGRVMRRAAGKKMGYVILPIGVPAGLTPEQALQDNERYKVVWQILNALRSHDERLDARLNQADLGVDISSQIEVIAISNNMPTSSKKETGAMGLGHGAAQSDDDENPREAKEQKPAKQLNLVFDEFSKAIMAKIVKKCGQRDYWENWAGDIAKIAQTHITRIKGIIATKGTPERAAFDTFLAEIHDDLNESITEEEAVEMLAQHLITKPVFDALFEGYSFTQNNPVSKAMQQILAVLNKNNLDKEAESLEKFYESVKRRAAGIDNAEAKQKIIVELYDKFFRNAFPKMTAKLGIVYTPVEVVDFIIHSVNDALKMEFGQTLGSKGVHIIDPFTGTGTFITRLLQSGLIKPEELEYKYKNEIHANEIVLLAYYIAAINIEAVYHSQSGVYAPFEGICLTDTFQLYEQKKDMLSGLMKDNSNRRSRQKALDIRVIMGNPPYSGGQKSANDDAANIEYPELDNKIRDTYAKHSKAGLQNKLYDSYIRAIRWGSDRLGDAGIMAYVSGSAWVERSFADGLRKCLKEEFSSLYVFHLRGDIRKNMLSKGKAGEGENVFGQGSMTGVAISLMVKNPNAKEHGKIYFHDIGLNLKETEKLAKIRNFKSIAGISKKDGWQNIIPDEHHDWLAQRDNSFENFIVIADKKKAEPKCLFEIQSLGVVTNRDAWCNNFSKPLLSQNISNMIDFYNSELVRYSDAKAKGEEVETDTFINSDSTKISWTANLKWDLEKKKLLSLEDGVIATSSYRPFTKMNLFYSRRLNERVLQMPRIFPIGTEQNLVIAVSGVGARAGFSVMLSSNITDLQFSDNGQCFPLYLYEKNKEDDDLFAGESGYTRRDAITDEGLKHFQMAYPNETFTKEDIFYYVYGLLHSPEYCAKYADNLSKQLPRIPCVKTAEGFWGFVKAGRALGALHVDYEKVEPYPVTIAQGDLRLVTNVSPETLYRVEKMKFAGKRPNVDKSTVIYNSFITMQNIPLEAYDYIVNGKAALDWVMDRQCVKIDKDSGIVNDANLYAIETMNNPAYPLELFQRVITVSLETMKIVNALPELDI